MGQLTKQQILNVIFNLRGRQPYVAACSNHLKNLIPIQPQDDNDNAIDWDTYDKFQAMVNALANADFITQLIKSAYPTQCEGYIGLCFTVGEQFTLFCKGATDHSDVRLVWDYHKAEELTAKAWLTDASTYVNDFNDFFDLWLGTLNKDYVNAPDG